MKKRSLLPALATLFVAGMTLLGGVTTADAGTIIQDFYSPNYPTTEPVPYTFDFTANQFNSALGTLNSVSITVTTSILGVVQVINISPTAENFAGATVSVPVSLTGTTANTSGIDIMTTATTLPQGGTVGAAPSGSFTKDTLPGMSATSMATANPAVGNFIGNGSADLGFAFHVQPGSYSGSAAPGLVFFGGSAQANAMVEIVYNYTPSAVPEPASMSLLGIGIAGFIAFRRIYKK